MRRLIVKLNFILVDETDNLDTCYIFLRWTWKVSFHNNLKFTITNLDKTSYSQSILQTFSIFGLRVKCFFSNRQVWDALHLLSLERVRVLSIQFGDTKF